MLFPPSDVGDVVDTPVMEEDSGGSKPLGFLGLKGVNLCFLGLKGVNPFLAPFVPIFFLSAAAASFFATAFPSSDVIVFDRFGRGGGC